MRVFAGLPLPENAKKKAVELIDYLQKDYKGLNFVKQDGLHITILFFGELSESQVNKISGIMDAPELKIPKIKTGFDSIGQFPPKGNPRVIFIDLKGETRQIVAYQQQYTRMITAAGFTLEKEKPFVPHITIARNKREQLNSGYLEGLKVPVLDFEFDRLVLYKSVLSASGAAYFPLKTVMFQ